MSVYGTAFSRQNEYGPGVGSAEPVKLNQSAPRDGATRKGNVTPPLSQKIRRAVKPEVCVMSPPNFRRPISPLAGEARL
jgi:hypothetical protein